jgi:hypothetical protein
MRSLDDALHDAGVIAKIDKGEVLAVLTAMSNPATDRHPLPNFVYAY